MIVVIFLGCEFLFMFCCVIWVKISGRIQDRKLDKERQEKQKEE